MCLCVRASSAGAIDDVLNSGSAQGCQVGLSEAKYGIMRPFLNVWPRNF